MAKETKKLGKKKRKNQRVFQDLVSHIPFALTLKKVYRVRSSLDARAELHIRKSILYTVEQLLRREESSLAK